MSITFPLLITSSSSSASSFYWYFLLMVISTNAPNFMVSSATLPPQLISLLSLKLSLKDPLSSFQDWDAKTALLDHHSDFLSKQLWCSWTGVSCDPTTGQVISLDLSNRNLSGSIPSELRNLSHLNYLNLSRNAFDGPLPTSIFELESLVSLDISHNNFNAGFPPGISKLRFLKTFDAYSNSFTGPLPGGVVRLRYLEHINLGGSYFGGSIPASYGGLKRLKYLHLAGNQLNGTIPAELGFLTQLQHLEIGYNLFFGGLPPQLGSLSHLQYLDISTANLSGVLPPELGNLTALESLLLFKNQFRGEIPVEFSNFRALKELDLSVNWISGKIPDGLSQLKQLTVLSLLANNLSGEIPSGIGELPNLETLMLWNNSLTGTLPEKLGSNMKLQKLDVSSNSLSGSLPPNLCLGKQLFKLILFSNKFDSHLPSSLANCTSLFRFRVEDNRFTGPIPSGFGFLPNLTYMDISINKFTGEIPRDLGNAPKLALLNISQNPINTALPDNIWSAPNLQIFSASFSNITGKIPDFKGCRSLYKLELEGNFISDSIPWDISHCQKLLSLNLRHNSLTGIIPWELSTLPSITDIDLSHNLLTGSIPTNFDSCKTLENFNVSYNHLTGPIPISGSTFSSLHPSSFTGNKDLCGEILAKPCPGSSDLINFENEADDRFRQQQQPKKTAGAIVWIMAAAFGIGLFVLIAGSRCFHANYARRFVSDQKKAGPWKLTAFQRLNFTADDVAECVSTTDKIIGMGSTGTVYMAEMPGGEIIAVKKLWSKQKETVRRRRGGVLAEVEVLGNVRHRNIVRLLGCCSNNETTLLLYEYMPNGSLDDLLHGKNKGENLVADWCTRYKIALGVAQGICYLHHDCDPVIVHRDVKSGNILLDGEMEARVADFGVAKLIEADESMSVIAGSYGYIAPEYAYTLQVDEKSDIYSYGVVLMEIVSGRRSVEAEYGEGNSIVDWIRNKIKKNKEAGMIEVLDKDAGASCASVREEMKLVLRVALLCTSHSPGDRPSMRDVVSMLQEAKPKRKLPGSCLSDGDTVNTNSTIAPATAPCGARTAGGGATPNVTPFSSM